MSARASAMRTALRILLTPSCWWRLGPTSYALTILIDSMLDAGLKPVRSSRYTCVLGGVELWASNEFFAYGYLVSGGYERGLPSRATAFRLFDALADQDRADLNAVQAEVDYAKAS